MVLLFYSPANLFSQTHDNCDTPAETCPPCENESTSRIIEKQIKISFLSSNGLLYCYYNVDVVFRICDIKGNIEYEIEMKNIYSGSEDCEIMNDADNVMKHAIQEALWQSISSGIFNIYGENQLKVINQSCIEKCTNSQNTSLHVIKPCPYSTCCKSIHYLETHNNTISTTNLSTINYSTYFTQCALIDCICGVRHVQSYNENCKNGCSANNLPIGTLKSSFSPPDCYGKCEEPWISNPNNKARFGPINGCWFWVFYEYRICGENQMRVTHIEYEDENCNVQKSIIYKESLKKILSISEEIFETNNNSQYQVLIINQPCWSEQIALDNYGRIDKLLVPCSYYLCCKTYYTLRYNQTGKKYVYLVNTFPPQDPPDCNNIYFSCENMCKFQDDLINNVVDYKQPLKLYSTKEDIRIDLIPQPAKNLICINSNKKIDAVTFYISKGELLNSNEILYNMNDNMIKLNTKALSTGIYFYCIIINNTPNINKFVIIK